MSRIAAIWLVVVIAPVLMFSQYGRRTRGPLGSATPGYEGPAATFRGNLRALTKKELRIDVVDAEEQSLTFRVSKKTRFLKDGKEIKRTDVPIGTIVAVDATRDPGSEVFRFECRDFPTQTETRRAVNTHQRSASLVEQAFGLR